MKEETKPEGREFRRETPEVRLVEDVRKFVGELGPEARRIVESLPTFRLSDRRAGA